MNKKTPDAALAPAGDRIAKVLSRAGVASRREAERMIELGQVSVNGKIIDSPALNVTSSDRIIVNGVPIGQPEPARLWLYYKPEGLVTSASDEKGRPTVFDNLPEDLPRVMSVGRLDLNSEGLLLLTNDGEIKRKLELPSTGWLRKYRVRLKGNPDDAALEPLRNGLTVDGEVFQPMIVSLDRIQGANAWLTVGLREGRNREIRRALSAIGLTVNRLIRVSYGPFRLGELQPGEVQEVRGKVLRDQLGMDPAEADPTPEKTRPGRPRPAAAGKDASGARPTDRARPAGAKPGFAKAGPAKAGPVKAGAAKRGGKSELSDQDPTRAVRSVRSKSAAAKQGAPKAGAPRSGSAKPAPRGAARPDNAPNRGGKGRPPRPGRGE